MSLRDELQAIYDQAGKLTPEIVLDVARDPAHPLHSRFEWDDSVAAERWRTEQAHQLIVSVKVTYRNAQGKPADVRAFHAVSGADGYEYRAAEDIVTDEVATQVLLNEMQRDWQQLKRRWAHFKEFAQLVRDDLGETG